MSFVHVFVDARCQRHGLVGLVEIKYANIVRGEYGCARHGCGATYAACAKLRGLSLERGDIQLDDTRITQVRCYKLN